MTPNQMTELAAWLKQLSSDYAFMNEYPGASEEMVNAADLIESMAQRVPEAADNLEPWYGHKFKEIRRGLWRCECGKELIESMAQRVPLSHDPTPEFVAWVRHNIPPGTVISDPDWWIPRLWRAVRNSTTDRQEDAT